MRASRRKWAFGACSAAFCCRTNPEPSRRAAISVIAMLTAAPGRAQPRTRRGTGESRRRATRRRTGTLDRDHQRINQSFPRYASRRGSLPTIPHDLVRCFVASRASGFDWLLSCRGDYLGNAARPRRPLHVLPALGCTNGFSRAVMHAVRMIPTVWAVGSPRRRQRAPASKRGVIVLAALVLAGIIAAPAGTIALLIKSSSRPATTGAWPPVARFATAVGGTVAARRPGRRRAAAAGGYRAQLDRRRRRHGRREPGLAAGHPALECRGHLCWSTTIFLFVVYLAFVLDWTLAAILAPPGRPAGCCSGCSRLFAAILACAYLWEICDALGSETWRRRITQAGARPRRRQRPAVRQPARPGP